MPRHAITSRPMMTPATCAALSGPLGIPLHIERDASPVDGRGEHLEVLGDAIFAHERREFLPDLVIVALRVRLITCVQRGPHPCFQRVQPRLELM